METRLLYCHCAYAQVVPNETKHAVLRQLCDSGAAFDSVADLCEMSARRDPSLQSIASAGAQVKIAACFPRAVKWLFTAAGAPLPEGATEILNMREMTPDDVLAGLFRPELRPNLPQKDSVPKPSESAKP